MGGIGNVAIDDLTVNADRDNDGSHTFETTEHKDNFALDGTATTSFAASPTYDSAGNLTYDSYVYSVKKAPADGDGIPVPTSRGVPGNLSTGIQVKVPANAVAFVSGLRPVIADSEHPSPRQAPVARSRRVSGLVLALLLVALAAILFLMGAVVFRARRQRRMPPPAS